LSASAPGTCGTHRSTGTGSRRSGCGRTGLKHFGEEEFRRLADQASELSRKVDFIRLQLRIGGELDAKGRLEASDLRRIAETVGVDPPAVKEFPPEDLWLSGASPSERKFELWLAESR
jgi:hypothetical protein